MKKPLVLAAVLVLAATPAAAQQRMQPLPRAEARVEQAAAPMPAQATIHVSQEEIRARVAANEAARNGEQIGSQSFWYMVIAVALGVILASLLLS